MKKILLLSAVFGAFASWSALNLMGASAQHMSSLATFSHEALTIQSGKKTYKFSVELALNRRQHAQGLMFRRRMAPNAGMLFVYRREEPMAMWMKNTFIPLDMLFITRGGRVRKIVRRTVPMSELIIRSGGPVVAVLELNAGTASRLGLKPGDKVVSTSLETSR